MRAPNRYRIASILVIVGFAIAGLARGQDSQDTQRQATETQATQTAESARAQAAQWDLSMPEWDRYRTLRQGIDGYRADKLDPITLLGMHARSDAERARYAEKLARLEHERIERVLAFQKAYDRAFGRLYPNEPRIRTDRVGRALAAGRQDAQRLGLDAGTRKAVFVRAEGCAACRQTVTRLADSDTPMDIFVVDAAGDDAAIRDWARRAGIEAAAVRRGDITLNHAPDAAAQQLAGQSLPRVLDR